MIDLTQFILLTVVVSLTVVLLIIGIQLIAILKEFKLTIQKTNKIMDDFGVVSESVANPVSAASSFLMNIRGNSLVSSVVKAVAKRRLRRQEEDE